MIVVLQRRQEEKAHVELSNGIFQTFKGYKASMLTPRKGFQA